MSYDELLVALYESEERFGWLARAMGLSLAGAMALAECERQAETPIESVRSYMVVGTPEDGQEGAG